MIFNETLFENDTLVKDKVLHDYRVAVESRVVALQGRRDVMGVEPSLVFSETEKK